MKCEKCHSADAQVKIVRIERDGSVNAALLCMRCAAEASGTQKQNLPSVMLDALLQEVIKQQLDEHAASKPPAETADDSPPCPNCGMTLGTYKKTYMLGCAECYEHFEETVEADLVKLHRAKQHVALDDPGADKAARQQVVRAIREELREAVEYEDFSRAAELRDRLARLESEEDAEAGHAAEGED